MGPTGGPETSVTNCRYRLRKIYEERRSHLYGGRSMKSRILQYYQLPDKKRDISRDIWNFSRRFDIFNNLFQDFLLNPKRRPLEPCLENSALDGYYQITFY